MPATSAPELEFIKNVLDVDVDALHHKNTYTIRAMYNATDRGRGRRLCRQPRPARLLRRLVPPSWPLGLSGQLGGT